MTWHVQKQIRKMVNGQWGLTKVWFGLTRTVDLVWTKVYRDQRATSSQNQRQMISQCDVGLQHISMPGFRRPTRSRPLLIKSKRTTAAKQRDWRWSGRGQPDHAAHPLLYMCGRIQNLCVYVYVGLGCMWSVYVCVCVGCLLFLFVWPLECTRMFANAVCAIAHVAR